MLSSTRRHYAALLKQKLFYTTFIYLYVLISFCHFLCTLCHFTFALSDHSHLCSRNHSPHLIEGYDKCNSLYVFLESAMHLISLPSPNPLTN